MVVTDDSADGKISNHVEKHSRTLVFSFSNTVPEGQLPQSGRQELIAEENLFSGSDSQATAVVKRYLCFQDYMQGLTRAHRQKGKRVGCHESDITALKNLPILFSRVCCTNGGGKDEQMEENFSLGQ